MFSVGNIGGVGAEITPVQFIGSRSNSVQSNGGALTCPMPSGSAVGDFIVAVLSCANLNDLTLALTSSGWTKQADAYTKDNGQLHGVNMGVFTKFRTVSDTSVAATGLSSDSRTFLSLSAFRNVHTTSPLDVAVNTTNNSSSSAILSMAVTPIRQGSMVVGGGMSSSFYVSGAVSSTLYTRNVAPYWYTGFGEQIQSASGIVTGYGVGAILWPGSGVIPAKQFDDSYVSGNYGCALSFGMSLRSAST